EQAQLALDRAEFDFQNAKASFVRLSGVAQLTDDAIPDSLPETSHDAAPYERLLAGFLAQKEPPTTEAIVLRHQLELEKLNYANQKTRLRPKLSAVIGSSQDEQSYTLNVAQKYRVNSLYAGFSVSWTIFDGFAASAAARTSLARKRQLENDYRQLTERLAQDAQSQVKQAGFAARNMSIYDRFLFNGRGAFEAVQQEFKRGEKSEADVSLAQLNVYDAQLNAYNARVDYLLKNGDFLGTLMEDPVLANVAADRK
ncbi:MAG: TolC family protein, partial [Opitutae bacterium]|nr:TolC family protein [Opitutae bacterium]